MKRIIILAAALPLLWGKAFAQKKFTTKAVHIYASPIFTLNNGGIDYRPNVKFHNLETETRGRVDSDYKPATLTVPNNWNIGAGLEYEFYLKNRWFIGVSVDFRTVHNKFEYRYNNNALLGELPLGIDQKVFNYTHKLNTASIGLYGGKQFKFHKQDKRLYEARLGLSFVFNTNRITTGEANYTYYMPANFDGGIRDIAFTKQYERYLNRDQVLALEDNRASLYFGSEGLKPLIRGTRLYGFYGIQADYNFLSPNGMTFIGMYDFQGTTTDYWYKSQQIDFWYSNTVNISLKLGLMLK